MRRGVDTVDKGRPGVATVVAAQAGDQRALDELVAGYLPLVYNVVGRALTGHGDVDDVVQETMLRVVDGLGGLRAPASFRSWLVAIAVRQIHEHGRRRMRAPVDELDQARDIADPGADFVDLTVLKLELSGQRREVAEATRWLGDDDRALLSLWWLEACGELTRSELAAALQTAPAHAAVRIQRVKATLAAARSVVRALTATPRCERLTLLLTGWDGRPDPTWRKRIARHTRECAVCEPVWAGQVPADRLLAGLALVPVPAMPNLLAAKPLAATTRPRSWYGLTAKPVAAAVAATVVACGAGLVYAAGDDTPPASVAQAAAPQSMAAARIPAPSTAPSSSSSSSSSSTSPPPSPPASSKMDKPAQAPEPAGPRYGSVVDTVDRAPDKNLPPRRLPERPAGTVTAAGGRYETAKKGYIGGTYVMMRRGENVVLQGRGYIQVRYEIAWFNRPGGMVMPTWTGLRGKLFHVASGGGHRMDDANHGQPSNNTWMGSPTVGPNGPASGYVVLPEGAQQMWQNEFFYLDGTVTLTNNERGADYNITATPKTWAEVTADITAPPPTTPGGKGAVRYGLVRDTGDDGAPVPQYLTRATPAGPADVPQRSDVG